MQSNTSFAFHAARRQRWTLQRHSRKDVTDHHPLIHNGIAGQQCNNQKHSWKELIQIKISVKLILSPALIICNMMRASALIGERDAPAHRQLQRFRLVTPVRKVGSSGGKPSPVRFGYHPNLRRCFSTAINPAGDTELVRSALWPHRTPRARRSPLWWRCLPSFVISGCFSCVLCHNPSSFFVSLLTKMPCTSLFFLRLLLCRSSSKF